MGVAIAGLICLAASILPLLPGASVRIPPDLQETLNMLVPALVVYLMARALAAKKQAEVTAEPAAAEEEDSGEEAAAGRARLQELERENDARAEKQRQLEKALSDTKARLDESRSVLSGSARDTLIDAEVLNLLSLLQEKGRLLDFLMDDIAAYQDAQVGAAARVVHQGCAAVLREYFEIAPVAAGKEGQPVTVAQDYSSGEYRLVGRVKGDPPYRGTLLHHGWRTRAVKLPRVVKNNASKKDFSIIAPAEVELA